MNQNASIRGTVVTGRGDAARFTRLDWVVHALKTHFGIDPHPGTLNLRLLDEPACAAWQALRAAGSARSAGSAGSAGSARSVRSVQINPPEAAACGAQCYALQLGGLPVAAVVPDVPGYPDDMIELVAALPLREVLSLTDTTSVAIHAPVPLAPRLVLFDVDGTLIDSMQAYVVIAEAAAAQEGLTVPRGDVMQALAFGRMLWDRTIPADHPDPAGVTKRLMQSARTLWPDTMRTHCRPFAGLDRTLAALRANGLRMGVVTGARPEIMALLDQAGLGGYFETVVSNVDVKRRKPDPEGLLLAAERLGIAPAEALYVGDSPIDIEAATAAGMRSVGVLTGAGTSAMLTRVKADRLIGSHALLPGLLEPPKKIQSQ